MAYATGTLTGTYQSQIGGTPAEGYVEIIPSVKVIKDTTGNVVLTGRRKIELDAEGSFTTVLPATDDTTLNPTGFGYTIVAKLRHQHLPAVSFQVPSGSVLDVEDVTPVDPATFNPTATYVEAADLAALEAEVAGKADTGYVDAAFSGAEPAGSVDAFAATLPDIYAKASDSANLADQAVGLARVADAFALTPGGAAISRSGDNYRLWHGLGGGLYARFLLEQQTTNDGGYPLHQLAGIDAVKTMLEAGHTAATKVGTWVTGSNAGAIGGAYVYSTTPGDTFTYTTPTDVTATALGAPLVTNGARLSKVDLDGDSRAADWFYTAQQVVDFGWYPNTILTTNGGTLDPRQRVLDSYAPTVGTTAWGNRPMLANGLAPTVHTVKVTVTEYVRVGKAATERAYLSGVGYATASTTPLTASAVVSTDTVLSDLNSAWEYAHQIKPTGATASLDMGNVHGYDEQLSLTFVVDGATVTLADGQTVTASKSVRAVRVSRLHHNETGPVADVTTTYTIDRRGLRVDVQTSWLVSADVDWSWIMLPVNGSLPASGQKFEMGTIMDYAGGPMLLSGVNGDQYLGRIPSPAAWLWSQQGTWAVAALVADTTTFLNRWVDSAPAYAQINDRNGTISKIYLARISAPKVGALNAGDVWRSSVRYLAAPFAGERKTMLRRL